MQRQAAQQHALGDDPGEQIEQQVAVRVRSPVPALDRAGDDRRGRRAPLLELLLVGQCEVGVLVLGRDQGTEVNLQEREPQT